MKSSTIHRFAIVWLALWFGVIVPGHKRGLVLLPGADPPPAARVQVGKPGPRAQMISGSGTCCPTSSTPASPSPGRPVTHCAVCYLTGLLDVPAPPDLAPRPLELVEVLPWPKPVTTASNTTAHIYFGRAPPISLA